MSDFQLWRNGVDITAIAEWDATWSEVVGGVGTATVTVQNREGDPALDFAARDIIKMTKGAWVLWEGEVVTPGLDLPVGHPFRRWRLTCSDWNTVPDLRLVNVPDGGFWQVPAGGDANLASGEPNGPYPIDPESTIASTDQTTIQKWYLNKVLAPDGGSFGTATFVHEYVPNDRLYDVVTGEPNFVPSKGTLKSAIGALSSIAAIPVYDWIDPDREVHHEAFEGYDIPENAPAPFRITDVRAEWNGTTVIGGRGLRIAADLTFGPQDCYVDGVTDFLELDAADPDIGLYGSRELQQGTGWGHGDHDVKHRQILVSGQSVTRAQRDALADSYIAYGSRPRYRGSIQVGGREDEGGGNVMPTGVRGGQKIQITDERLPDDLNDRVWPIQRLNGVLIPGVSDTFFLTIEFGDAPIGRFSERFANDLEARRLEESRLGRKPKAGAGAGPAMKHVIQTYKGTLLPGETIVLEAQARDNSDNPVHAAGIRVHWQIDSVLDENLVDQSGNGEGLDPEDTVTNEFGTSTTKLTGGSVSGVWYVVSANTPYQDL